MGGFGRSSKGFRWVESRRSGLSNSQVEALQQLKRKWEDVSGDLAELGRGQRPAIAAEKEVSNEPSLEICYRFLMVYGFKMR